jgi:hypothetical protein
MSQEELKIHYRNRDELRKRIAMYGPGQAPLFLHNQLDAVEETIRRLEPELGLRPLDDLYQKGVQAMLNGQWVTAIKYLEQVVARDPLYENVAELLEEAELRLQQKKELDKLYRKGVQAMLRGRWATTIKYLEEVAARDPLYENTAELLEEAKLKQEAQERRSKVQLWWQSQSPTVQAALITALGAIIVAICGLFSGIPQAIVAHLLITPTPAIAIATNTPTPTPTLTSTVTPSLTSTWTPAPTITHPSTLTPMPSEEVLIEIDGVLIDASDDRCREIVCNSSPRIQVTVLDSAEVSLQPDIFSYNWRFDPPDLHNPDRLDSKNYAIIYSVPCDLNNQTVTIEVLKDGETLYVRSVRFNIKEQP